MAASISDYFNNATETTRPDPAALTAQKLIGAASITVDTTAGWATGTAVHLTMYQVDAGGNKVANTQTDWKSIVTSGTTFGSLTLKAGTDAVYPVGSKVICAPTGAWADDLVTGLQVSLDQDGTLKAGAVDVAAVLASDVVTTAKILDSNVTAAKLDNGVAVQVASTSISAVATGTTVIPYDDTIPQNTEGDQYMSLSITPKSATNILVIQVVLQLSSSVADNLTVALFQDSTANALAAIGQNNIASPNAAFAIPLTHRMVAGTTSSTTFKVRAAGSQAGTRTINGSASGRKYGGISSISSIVITEYKAA